jgi:hypothetical protein
MNEAERCHRCGVKETPEARLRLRLVGGEGNEGRRYCGACEGVIRRVMERQKAYGPGGWAGRFS